MPPKRAWVLKVAEATMRSEATVRMWLSERQAPDDLAKREIAKVLQRSVEELFPEKS